MKKLALTLIVISLCSVPALAAAQDDGAYQENPPTLPNDNGGNGGNGGDSPTGTGTGTGDGTGSGTAATGTGAGGGSGSASLSEAEAARAGTAADAGQLPATGFGETVPMALLGTVLLVGGLVLYRRALARE
jgi:LPXTG-motif cell wall-anchored protein